MRLKFRKFITNKLILKFSNISRFFLASTGYRIEQPVLKNTNIDVGNSWNPKMIKRQSKLWAKIIRERGHNFRKDITALSNCVDLIPNKYSSICEIGCASGYNKLLLDETREIVKYIGVDIELTGLRAGQKSHPQSGFIQASSEKLPFRDSSFDVVIDGAALIHIQEWKASLSEYARTTKKYIILHSLTLSDTETSIFSKFAYGFRIFELFFNRAELIDELSSLNLNLLHTENGEDYNLEEYLGTTTCSESWLLEKIS